MAISDDDLTRLGRCVELAQEALDDGDEPFGSVLIDAEGRTLFEDRNRVKDGDHWGAPPQPVAPLPITTVAPHTVVEGPAASFTDAMKALYQAKFRP